MTIRSLPLMLMALAAIALPVGAEECVPTTSTTDDEQIVLTIPTSGNLDGGAGDLYVANDLCQDDARACLFSVWFYMERNGIPGLQRGDEMRDDTCGGMIEADYIDF